MYFHCLEPHIFTREKKKDIVLEEGETAKFKCMVSKKYTTSWQWSSTHGGNVPKMLEPTNRIRLRDHVFLKIRQVTKNDTGMYFCTVTNQYGTTQQLYTLTVKGNFFICCVFFCCCVYLVRIELEKKQGKK